MSQKKIPEIKIGATAPNIPVWISDSKLQPFPSDAQIDQITGALIRDSNERSAFFQDPKGYIQSRLGLQLSDAAVGSLTAVVSKISASIPSQVVQSFSPVGNPSGRVSNGCWIHSPNPNGGSWVENPNPTAGVTVNLEGTG